MINIEQQSYNLFPTLVMMFDLSKLPIKDRVIKLIETSSNHSHRLTESGSSTYSESTPNQLLSHPDISMLKNIMQNCIDAYVAKAGIQKCSISNSWANMLGNGASVGIHRHELSVVSGAYYPLAQQGSTPLILRSPIAMYKMHEYSVDINEFSMQEQEIPCTEDLLVIFPSWLEHYSKPNTTDKRYTVSFNTKY